MSRETRKAAKHLLERFGRSRRLLWEALRRALTGGKKK